MKRTLFQGLVLSLLILAAVPAAALTHNFQSMQGAGKLSNVGSVYTSADDGIVYTLGGTADIYWDYAHRSGGTGAKICLNLLANGAYAIVSPALSHLSEVVVNYTINKVSDWDDYVTVYLSTDGSDWASITPSLSYTSGRIVVTPPSLGAYYIKIACIKSAQLSITQITYTFSDCNCFTYTPE